jgi:hypothetical protein
MLTDDEEALRSIGWSSTWMSRVDSDKAISSLSDFVSLELAPLDEKQNIGVVLVAWPNPSTIHAELFGKDGSHIELGKLRDVLLIGERIFRSGFEEQP